jgi:hypothetical protein
MSKQFPGYYTHPSFKGIALFVRGYAQTWEPYTYLETDDNGDEYECDSDEGEWVDNEDRVIVTMVGDDRKHEVDPSDLAALPDDEFCDGCGSIGCGHGSNRE